MLYQSNNLWRMDTCLMDLKVCLNCDGAKDEFLCRANWSISSIRAFSSSSFTGSINDNERLKWTIFIISLTAETSCHKLSQAVTNCHKLSYTAVKTVSNKLKEVKTSCHKMSQAVTSYKLSVAISCHKLSQAVKKCNKIKQAVTKCQ